MTEEYVSCRLCPRRCGINRTLTAGRCGVTAATRVAAAMLHRWEEPCISGKNGSGAVFFSGCGLRCAFCQNAEISQKLKGVDVTVERLAGILRRLCDAGAETLDLVTPTHFAPAVFSALDTVKPNIPVVWNSGGYELAERIPEICRRATVYMPDVKFCSPELSDSLCGASDYFERALEALVAAVDTLGSCEFDKSTGIIKRGVIVRHLILPGHREDSEALLRRIAVNTDVKKLRLSLMRQYTPMPDSNRGMPELNRHLTGFEYEHVLAIAEGLGYCGWSQGRQSAQADYIPDFNLTVMGEPL